jgi:hypothetical protein
MKTQRVLTVSLVVCFLLLCFSLYAQVTRPYRNGSVWTIAFIRMKPGMDNAYKNYLATDWKKQQEALKSAGISLSYKVFETEAHDSEDWNLLLLTEFKDLASLEANEKKADALAQRVVGTDEKQMQGYKERADIREVMGQRLAREIVMEPRQ